MIRLNKGDVALEGKVGDLIIEAARIVDAVASSVSKKSDKEGGDLNYDFVVESVLNYLAQIQKIGEEDNNFGYEQEIEFLQEARNLRKQYSHEEDFIDYDGESRIPRAGALKKKASTKAQAKVDDDVNNEVEETKRAQRSRKKPKSTTSISGGAKLGDFVIDSRVTDDDIMDLEDLKAIKDLQKKNHKRRDG